MGRLIKWIAILLPLAGFACAVLRVRALMEEGQGLLAICCLLGALVAFALVEAVLFKFWILPPFAGELGERVYSGGNYSPADDALVVLVERIRKEKDRSLLPALEHLVLADARRTRGWQEYAHVLQDVFGDAPAALEALRRGAVRVRGREDRAMLLCRAAFLAADALHDAELSRSLYSKAAKKYPRTAYGRFAAQRVNGGAE